MSAIEKLQEKHFLVEAEQTTSDERECDAGQPICPFFIKDLAYTGPYQFKVFGGLRTANRDAPHGRMHTPRVPRRVRLVKSRVKYAIEVFSARGLEDAAWAKYLAPRKIIQLVLNCIAISVPNLTANGIRVPGQHEIGLLAVHDGGNVSVKQIAPRKRKFDMFQFVAMNDLHELVTCGPVQLT